jgi:hypothetical protein
MLEVHPERTIELTDLNRDDRSRLRPLVAIGLVIALGMIVLILNANAYGAPMAQTVSDGATIVLTDEPCKLKQVTNLKYRATWSEKGKVFEGCYAVHPYGVVVGYFSDGAVALIPLDAFAKVTGV